MEENTCFGSLTEKDEYWGRWIRCHNCDYANNTSGATYCGGCGNKLLVVDFEFEKSTED